MPNPRWKIKPAGSTWGDFGPDDQLGRLNLVTPEKVKQGLRGGQVRLAQQLEIGEHDPRARLARLLEFAGEERGLSDLASSLHQDDAVPPLDCLPEFMVRRPQQVEPGAERNGSAHRLQRNLGISDFGFGCPLGVSDFGLLRTGGSPIRNPQSAIRNSAPS